jgi:HK97 family phage major capsid protein
MTRAAVGAATPGSAAWGAEFIDTSIAADFIEAVRAATVVDRLAATRKVPFTHPVPAESTSGFSGAWAGEGQPLPVAAGDLTQITLPRTSAGAIAVLSGEARELLLPSHERFIRDVMIRATTAYLDAQFLDPAVTAIAETRPASITNGATSVASTGATAAAILADLRNMLAAVNADLTNPTWVMRRRDAVHIAGLMGANGGLQFPNAPREVLGIPVLVSSAVPATAGSPPEDRYVVLIDQDSVCVADEGRMGIDVSGQATIEMSDTPSNNAKTGTGTSMVSMWQSHSVAWKVIREISWARGHEAGVAYMQVSW